MKKTHVVVSTGVVEKKILFLRGERVLLDRDLAELYQVKSIALRQAVKRNKKRFPEDFLFQLTKSEAAILVSQSVIPSQQSLGGHLPYAFTEQGVAMLSSVLRSGRAVHVNVEIMRAFVRLREILSANVDLARKLDQLEGFMELRTPFNPLQHYLANGGAAAVRSPASLVLPPNTPPQLAQQIWAQAANTAIQKVSQPGLEVPFAIVNAVVESTRVAADRRTDGTLSAARMATGQINLSATETRSGWNRVPIPNL